MREIEFEGKRIIIDEDSWAAGHEAAWRGNSVEEVQEALVFGSSSWDCPMSYSAGYVDGIEEIGKGIAEHHAAGPLFMS